MEKKTAQIKLPFTQGSADGGFNANVMYDAEGSSVAMLYGIPQSMTLAQLGKAVECGEFNNAWDVGAARAAFIVRACNSHDELVSALRTLLMACPLSVKVENEAEFNAARAILRKVEAS